MELNSRISIRLLLGFACLIPNISNAQAYQVVNDPKATVIVLENMAAQSAIEREHNNAIDSISKKQKRIATYTTAMATARELYKLAMENYRGWGTESRMYGMISESSIDILTRLPNLYSHFCKGSFPGQTLCLMELGDLSIKTYGLVDTFIKIVNNSKVKNPLENVKIPLIQTSSGTSVIDPEESSMGGNSNDGYNLLSRYDRLNIATQILRDLEAIRYKIIIMDYQIRFATMNDLYRRIDVKSYHTYLAGLGIVERGIKDWKANTKGGLLDFNDFKK